MPSGGRLREDVISGGAGGLKLYEYDDDDGGERSPLRVVIGFGVAVVLAALAWFVVRPALGEDDEAGGVIPVDDTELPTGSPAGTGSIAADGSTIASSSPTSTDGGVSTASAPDPTTSAVGTTTASNPAVTTSTTGIAATSVPGTTTTTGGAAATTTTTAGATSTTGGTAGGATYETLPDGSPVPIVATFGVDTVTLEGTVPSRAASERLAGLARANSRTPATVEIRNQLAINPDVPISVGVRVIELTSARFPAGSAEVLLAHAAELNRIATVMRALPNVTVLVVGHADQQGDAAANFALSEERARAVVNYLVSVGIDGARLSSRAVGESDLLTINNDATALALNRRTEFILYGLLVE